LSKGQFIDRIYHLRVVSKTGFTFEFHLGVDASADIRTAPNIDTQKSKAHEIYRSLVIRKQRPVMTELGGDHTQSPTSTPKPISGTFQGDGPETLDSLQQPPPDVANWPQEMDLAKLPSVNERSCEQWYGSYYPAEAMLLTPDVSWLKTIEIPIMQGSTLFSAIARHAFALRMLQRQQIRKTEERMAWLSHSLARVSSPRSLSGRKSDLDVWRTILKLILDAKILNKKAHGTPGSRGQLTSVQRLMRLRNQISEARLVS
jgi:hypothetical protein